jgi:hypothetical protein
MLQAVTAVRYAGCNDRLENVAQDLALTESAWRRWLDFAGGTAVPHHGSPLQAELAMEAAIEGAGVVLGRSVLAEGDLESGKLVCPFNIVLILNETYRSRA